MMEEDRQRYQRSASLSPNESNKSRSHQLSPKEPSIPPEVPPFRLLSERQINQKDQIGGTDTASRKRKRSLTPSSDKPVLAAPASNALVLSTPQNTEPKGAGRFRGIIGHKRAQEALDFAWKMENCVMKTGSTHRHIFWTDGSIVYRACAAGAVVWKQQPSWKWMSEGFAYPYLTESTDVVEMFAIAHALKRAVDEVKQSLSDAGKDLHLEITHEVFVFTDSLGALTGVERDTLEKGARVRITSEQAHTIIKYSIDLDNLGAKVELHLVPGHSGVPGNDNAHAAAYAAAQHAAAKAGIKSKVQALALYRNRASVVMFPPTGRPLVPASPVQAGSSRGSRKRAALLSQPLLWGENRAKAPPMLVSPLDPTDEDEEELVNMKGELSISIPGPHSVRPDRTPETAPVPGQSFTSVNAGSRLSTGFTPVNPSSTSSARSPAKVSFARVKRLALTPQHWFTPFEARSTLRIANSPQSLSASIQQPALDKKQETGTVVARSAKSPKAHSSGSALQKEPASIDNAATPLGPGQLSFNFVNNVPAAVLDSSAVSKSCSEHPHPARTPGSMLSSASFLHRFRPPNSGKAVFGETALSSFIPYGNQQAAKTSAGAAGSPCLDFPVPTTNAVSVPAFNQASFPAPKPSDCFSPRHQTNHSPNPSGDAAPPPSRSILDSFKGSTSFVTTSKMRSFASPGEPKDGITLAPLSSFYDDKLKQHEDTALPSVPLSISEPQTPSLKFTISKMELFASPEEPRDGMRVPPLSSSYDDKSKQCADTALPPLPPPMLDVPKPSSLMVTTSKMRSFESPVEPRDGITLASISSFNESHSRPTMSPVPRWPLLFTQPQTISPDVAKSRSVESPSNGSSSASNPATTHTSSLPVTLITEGVNSPADIASTVPLNPSTGVYIPPQLPISSTDHQLSTLSSPLLIL